MAEIEDRHVRRMMRQRGAGPRQITTNFGFVFQAGPIKALGHVPAPAESQAISNALETESASITTPDPPNHGHAPRNGGSAPALTITEVATQTVSPPDDSVAPKKKRKIRKSEDSMDWFKKRPKTVPVPKISSEAPIENAEPVATVSTPPKPVGATKRKRKVLIKRSTVAKFRNKENTEPVLEGRNDSGGHSMDVDLLPLKALEETQRPESQLSTESVEGTKAKRKILVKRTTTAKYRAKKSIESAAETQPEHTKSSGETESSPLKSSEDIQICEPIAAPARAKRTVSKAKKVKKQESDSADLAVAPRRAKRTVVRAKKTKEPTPSPVDSQGEEEDELSSNSLQNIVTSKPTKKPTSTKKTAQGSDNTDTQTNDTETKRRVKAVPRKRVAKKPLAGDNEAAKADESVSEKSKSKSQDGEALPEAEVAAKDSSGSQANKSTKNTPAVIKADMASTSRKRKTATQDTYEAIAEPRVDAGIDSSHESAVPGHRMPLKERSSNSSPYKSAALSNAQTELDIPQKPTKHTTKRKTTKTDLMKDEILEAVRDECRSPGRAAAITEVPEQPQKPKARQTASRTKTGKPAKCTSLSEHDHVQRQQESSTTDELDFVLFNDVPAGPVKKPRSTRNVKKRTYNDDSELDLDQMLDGIASIAAISGNGQKSTMRSKER